MNPNVPTRDQKNVSVISIAFPDYFLIRRVLITLLLLTALYFSASAQTVTEVITDYSGYWKSAQSAFNTVKPDNSHNMLALHTMAPATLWYQCLQCRTGGLFRDTPER